MNKNLITALSSELKEYRSIPFWSWNNNLDDIELCRQIEDMKSAGMGGFIIHARTGLKEEYLGEKWFSCIGACLKKAKELDREAWIYDENGWPSGFVGGKLLENETFRARFLEYSVGSFDKLAFASYVRQGDDYIRIDQKLAGEAEYHNIYLRVSPANTDILNSAVTEAFLAETHEKYFERFKDSFGNELKGFFTDEPQYYRWATPYSPAAEKKFAAQGEDIRDGLIWLFIKGERGYSYRQKYYGVMNKLYIQNYYKKLYDWCTAHNCMLTGHSLEESSLHGQMYGGAAVMPTYEYEHIPGIDWLGKHCGNEIAPRQIGSVAAQLGKKFVLTETFGCAGYDITPKELKSIGEYQYFNGINKMCQHLYPYSLAGRGKTDHPPVFSPQSNWFEAAKIFNDYFARLGYIVGETEDFCEVGILHPIRDIWLDYVREEDEASVAEQEKSFENLLGRLRKRGVTFQLIDESVLAKHGKAENGMLCVGKCAYHTVIVPQMRTLEPKTYELLQKFTGKLCLLGNIRYIGGEKKEISLHADVTLEEILAGAVFGFSCEDGKSVLTARKGEFGEFLFIQNMSGTEESQICLLGAAEKYLALDLEMMKEMPLPGDNLCLAGAESLILIKGKGVCRAEPFIRREDVTKYFRVTGVTENFFVLDYAQIARGNEAFGTRRPIPALFEELLRENYKGELRVRQTFILKEKIPLSLVMEKADFTSVLINDISIKFDTSRFDVNFISAQIGDAVREGENEILYKFDFWQHDGVRFALFDPLATESLRNCLYYDTSIEPAYLKGDFIVGKDFVLEKRLQFPPVTDRLYEAGYPFFKGTITLEGKIVYCGVGEAILNLCGRFMSAEVYANEKRIDIVLDTKKDISSILHRGENNIKIVLRSSLRNLFGPHHFADSERVSITPYHFEFRGAWTEELPADYTEKYNFVPFGIRKLYFQQKI